ncbi:hypothetical protein [Vibrio sonorensis]|uniref:hypothetical protein n=1 Tax=Vibrio sonorensis TaxID=1004316 RepID=UPI0011135EA6|nr:hypothetical protein [Vibrio sonorensis]
MKKLLIAVSAIFMAAFAFAFSLIMIVPVTLLAWLAQRKARKHFYAYQAAQPHVIDGEWEEVSRSNHSR